MTMTFKTHFSRYANGETRISNPQWINADDFRDAAHRADYILCGLRGADPESRYEIASIDGQFRGIECAGALMFETAEELTARVADKA